MVLPCFWTIAEYKSQVKRPVMHAQAGTGIIKKSRKVVVGNAHA